MSEASDSVSYVTEAHLVDGLLFKLAHIEGVGRAGVEAFVSAALDAGWFEGVVIDAEELKGPRYPETAVDFLTNAYQLFELGADLQLIALSIAEPLALIGQLVALCSSFEDMAAGGDKT